MEAEVNVENKGVGGGGVMLCLCLSFTRSNTETNHSSAKNNTALLKANAHLILFCFNHLYSRL